MYKLYKNSFGQDNFAKTNEDGSVTSFGQNPDNTDYQAYLKYIAEGGVVLPADDNEQAA
jgi:hypothetical protein